MDTLWSCTYCIMFTTGNSNLMTDISYRCYSQITVLKLQTMMTFFQILLMCFCHHHPFASYNTASDLCGTQWPDQSSGVHGEKNE